MKIFKQQLHGVSWLVILLFIFSLGCVSAFSGFAPTTSQIETCSHDCDSSDSGCHHDGLCLCHSLVMDRADFHYEFFIGGLNRLRDKSWICPDRLVYPIDHPPQVS